MTEEMGMGVSVRAPPAVEYEDTASGWKKGVAGNKKSGRSVPFVKNEPDARASGAPAVVGVSGMTVRSEPDVLAADAWLISSMSSGREEVWFSTDMVKMYAGSEQSLSPREQPSISKV